MQNWSSTRDWRFDRLPDLTPNTTSVPERELLKVYDVIKKRWEQIWLPRWSANTFTMGYSGSNKLLLVPPFGSSEEYTKVTRQVSNHWAYKRWEGLQVLKAQTRRLPSGKIAVKA
jgi:hypothetical protein